MREGTAANELADLLAEAGIRVGTDVQERLLRHLEWLLATNERMNLTAITDESEAMRLHIVDSLIALDEVNQSPAGVILDIGTGGGFPGVPLAIASGRRALLLDSVGKKARALEEYLQHQEPDVHASAERAEERAISDRDTYAVVLARAVAPLASLVELASPLLTIGGRLIALKGRVSDAEAESADRAATICGLARLEVRHTCLPRGFEGRTIWVFEKLTVATIPLPRRTGLAQKKPLGEDRSV